MLGSRRLIVLASVLALALGGSGAATAAASPVHHFRGKVTAVHRADHWFALRTTTRRTVRIYTNSGTHWAGCNWGEMHHGHSLDVRAHRSHGHWVASRMQDWNHHHSDHHGSGHDDE